MSGDARLWEMPSGKQRFVLQGHTQGLLYALFSPDGRTVATVSTDEKVKFWHVATGQELTTLHLRIPRFSFGPDGNFMAIGWADADSSAGHLRLRGVPTLEEIDRSNARTLDP